MREDQAKLWQKVKKFHLDDPRADFTFTDRLARENDWSLEFAARCVMEYKKFMFLICISEHPLTPSDEVDQVWHLHLLYTESYWKLFCQQTLGQEIHHGPTLGGQQERDKFDDWYAATKRLYQNTFKVEPPQDIWPNSEIRFGQIHFSRVNRHTHWVISKNLFSRLWKR